MAENQEKTEAELLEEAMQNLGLEEVVDEEKAEEVLVEGAPLSDEEIESLIKEDEPDMVPDEESNDIKTDTEKPNPDDEISDVDDINLNTIASDELNDIPDNSVLNEEEFDVQKKQSKIVRVLIIVVSILLTFVSIGVLLYFIGFFDPEPVIVKEVKTEVVKPQKEEYEFKQTDIDTNRLNKKLNLLTKYEIVENSSTEESKAKEKENLYIEAKKQLEMEKQAQIERIKEAERKRLEETLPPVQKEDISQTIDKEIEKVIDKEEMPAITTKPEVDEVAKVEEVKPVVEEAPVQTKEEVVATPIVEEKKAEEPQVTVQPAIETPVIEEPKIEEKPKSQFVKVIKIATKSQDVYKSFLDKIYSVSDNVTLCRDYQNNVEIFIGPFDDDLSRDKIKEEYLSKYNINTEIYDYTIEEYDKRCNY